MSQPNQQPTPEHRLGAHDFLHLEDEILKGALVTHQGEVVNEGVKKALSSGEGA